MTENLIFKLCFNIFIYLYGFRKRVEGGHCALGTGPDRTEPDRTGPNRTAPDSTGPDWTGLDRTGLDSTGPDRSVRATSHKIYTLDLYGAALWWWYRHNGEPL